jgi:tetratricopeptide (TPR) repeat protein
MDLMKLSVSLYELGNWEEAEKWVDELLRHDSTSSEGFNLKGLILLKKKKFQESTLSFEQAVKHNNSKSAVTKSLIEITKIKI